MVRKGRLRGKKEIDDRVRTILKKYRIGKHFNLDIREDGFIYKVNEDELIAEITAKSKGNQELIEKRLKRSRTHIESISRQLAKLSRKIDKGRLHGQDKIGVRVGKVINKYKVGKHFELDIRDNDFSFGINRDKVKKEAALDAIAMESTSYEPAFPKREWMQTRRYVCRQYDRIKANSNNMYLQDICAFFKRELQIKNSVSLIPLSTY
ncbi:hypothetical protein BuS5_00209 [Desulfosarcina sp. BuS5]|uniref:hypothetical protein n=1 Tax=Desulfosarcina sp. BuS5 TaxID=933262 RepID=UPI0023794A0A|nr:hypothetical protein [Desulfosarcina sp. BuS5]WDN87241.1 hypothetical protein BuS5_00209 [Desulfosarcina sp. BuS5]